MRVAVITPYSEPRREWLEQCHQSVMQQVHDCTHILVADGNPVDYVEKWDAQHIIIKNACQDFGDTPRAVGTASAIGQGFDAIAYLDFDNWYHHKHIKSLVNLHKRSKAPVCVSHRLMMTIDGEPLGECVYTHPKHYVNTSCYFFHETGI